MWLHGECSPSLLGRWIETAPACELPEVGDAIGPYSLRRELGRGGFARVFLAEQTNLENRLVVLKVSTRMTREPWLLARVRHRPHRRDRVARHGRRWGVPLDLHAVLGGATLAAVLAAARVGERRRTASGRDLLADLDAVAAPEFPTVHPARPAREILAGLTYSQAMAWVGARLAEALDHAFSRDVAHGDVKPSNILLSADGNPMLLDFNLAREPVAGRPGATPSSDPGGTLAYMAPERLQGLATDDPARDDSSLLTPAGRRNRACEINVHLDSVEGTRAKTGRGSGPHLADIYSLGMVLLEALTGQPPSSVAICWRSRPRLPTSANSEPRPARMPWRALAARRPRSTSPKQADGSRLRRACAPSWNDVSIPTRADAIGADWSSPMISTDGAPDRPLVYTSEPFWGQTVPRWLRRQRRALIVTAAALSLLVGLPRRLVVMLQFAAEPARRTLCTSWPDTGTTPRHGLMAPSGRGTPRFPSPDDHQVSETAAARLERLRRSRPRRLASARRRALPAGGRPRRSRALADGAGLPVLSRPG